MRAIRATRNADFGALQELFLITAAATILVIRTDLWLTNYPQIGGNGLHIAHLLWGGLFMVGAIALLVTYLGRASRQGAAILGGVGFGFFIDELGKFITSDNDYFYKPAAALIYLIFIALFLGSRAMRRHRRLSDAERLANVVELVGEAARGRFDVRDRERALRLLDGDEGPLAARLRELVEALAAAPPRPPGRVVRTLGTGRAGLNRLVGTTSRPHAIGWVFLAWAVLSVLTVSELVFELTLSEGGHAAGFASDSLDELSLINVASLASGLVSMTLVVIGLFRLLRGERLEAYRTFERAALVAIFVTRVFIFVESQFAAVLGLALDVLLLVSASAAVARERRASPPAAVQGTAAAATSVG